jgi:hypothetical protein
MNPRNFLLLIALFIVLIVGFVVVGNLLNALVPLIVTAIIAFILGRLSIHFNLLDFIRSARLSLPSRKPAAAPEAATKSAAVPNASTAKAAAAPSSEEAIPQKAVNPDLLLDPQFEIKTPDQIEAEARLREQEATKRAASTDVNAALEERRKRLLGNKDSGG